MCLPDSSGGCVLDQSVIAVGVVEEIEKFRDLVAQIPRAELDRRTRFWGLAVRDVAAHVAGVVTDTLAGRTEGIATPVAVARQVQEREQLAVQDLVSELDAGAERARTLLAALDDLAWASPAPGEFDGTLAEAVQAVWEDVWLHGDDIRQAVTLPPDRGRGLTASVHHVAGQLERRGWAGTLSLTGVEPLEAGAEVGETVTGDAHSFVLVATSRALPSDLGFSSSLVVET
jgi:uncharacterized protein (TIGR03083 family)